MSRDSNQVDVEINSAPQANLTEAAVAEKEKAAIEFGEDRV